jgi:hypothetical protein
MLREYLIQGHDDAAALMMACQLENIKLLGVSSVCKAAFSRIVVLKQIV